MRRPIHGRFFNYFYVVALLLIVAIFGVIGYFLAVSDVLGSNNATTMIVLMGGGIGALALLTGVVFLIAQIDTRLVRPTRYDEPVEEDEPANYGAPRV